MRGEYSPCAKGLEVPRMHQQHRSAARLVILNSSTQVWQSQRLQEEPSRLESSRVKSGNESSITKGFNQSQGSLRK
eukprot:5727064-Pleurochrysis_carterae.AAC.2